MEPTGHERGCPLPQTAGVRVCQKHVSGNSRTVITGSKIVLSVTETRFD